MKTNDKIINEAIAMGERNLEVIKLAQNFCSHLQLDKSRMSGTGIIEQMTGLPVGLMECRCQYARAHGLSGGNSEEIALDFYERNCVDCDKRVPVGMPSLLNLVEERKKKELEQKKQQEMYAHKQALELAKRKQERVKLKNVDQSRNSIIDLIDRVDEGSQGDSEKLIETAKIAWDKFDPDIQGALFDLASTNSFLNVKCALEVLSIIANRGQSINTDKKVILSQDKEKHIDIDRLVILSLKALDKSSGHNEAATIIEFWFKQEHGQYLTDNSIHALIRIAYPARELPFSGTTYRPGPLQQVYALFPRKVLSVVEKLLKVDEKWTRISAAGAAGYILEKDEEFGLNIADYLLDSLSLPDDMYDGGSANVAAMHTLGKAFIKKPLEIDKMIQDKIDSAPSDLKGEIFNAYDFVFRGQRHSEKDEIPENVKKLAIKRVFETLLAKPNDERFEKATHILRGLEYENINFLIGGDDLLLGAAAQISTEIDNPYCMLTDPRPDPIKVMVSSTRRIQLQSALDIILVNIGRLGRMHPISIGSKIIECIKNIKPESGRLKSSLISVLGTVGSNAEGLPLILPTLSAGFVDNDALVRSSAVESYGSLMKNKIENLPDTIHELFCASFSDPYTVVHRQAVEVLGNIHPREKDIPLIRNKLIVLILAYRQEKGNAEFLARCVDELLDLTDRFQTVETALGNFILKVMPSLDPYERVKIFLYHWHQLKEAEGYSEQLALLLLEEDIYSLNLNEAIDLIKGLSITEVVRTSSILKEGTEMLIKHNIYWQALKMIELLSTAYCYDIVLELTRFLVSSIEDTVENKPLRLKAQAYEIAAGLELTLLSKDDSKIENVCKSWKENLTKIQKDDEENNDRRNFFKSI